MSVPRSVVYLGLYDPRGVPGVHRKTEGTLRAAAAAGYTTRWWTEPFSGTAPLWRLAAEIVRCDEGYLILRSLGWANLFLLIALARARLQGKVVVLEVPSPNRVAIREVWRSRQSLWRRIRTVAAFLVSGPWSLWPASRIVQYADEGWWFQIGNASRTVKTANGIDVDAVPFRLAAPPWPSPVLRLVGVASFAEWHGYDRLLRAVKVFRERPDRPFDVHVTLVGEGPARPGLEQLAFTLGLGERVVFTGPLESKALADVYGNAHLAVSSLALHRIGLDEASVLKAREYCAAGVPFIAAAADPDFPAKVPFRFEVMASDEIESVMAAFEDFASRHQSFAPADLRRYAVDHLDFRHKIRSFGLA